jgi:hypothetical protein
MAGKGYGKAGAEMKGQGKEKGGGKGTATGRGGMRERKEKGKLCYGEITPRQNPGFATGRPCLVSIDTESY